MKEILSPRKLSGRYGYDGWALRVRGTGVILRWSLCTTRQEARELRSERLPLFRRARMDVEVVKVKAEVKAVA